MLAVHCPDVRTRTGLVLVPESRIASIADDGAGTITLQVRCWSGHLHEVVTGRAATEAAAVPLRPRTAPAVPAPAVPAAVAS